MSSLLSKSTFIRSLQCQKSLYLYKNYYNLRDEISFERQAVFDRGHQVGFLAWQLFPGGKDAGWDSPKEYKKFAELTQNLIKNQADVIYEASFVWNNVLVAADILVREKNGWHVYEVKSSLSITETYLRDAALQYYIISKSGLPLSGISIIHPDRAYIRQEKLDVCKYFRIENITVKAEERIPGVIQGLIQARRTLETGLLPEITIGPHCDDPYECDFKGYCGWSKLPQNSVFELTGLEETRKWELFGHKIIHLKDVPEDFYLTDAQKIEWQSKVNGTVHIDKPGIEDFFNKVHNEMAFLDLQTFRSAVPEVWGANPYAQVPFGFALKTQQTDEKETSPYVYVSPPTLFTDKLLAENLISATEGVETLVVFDKKKDMLSLQYIAVKYPELEVPIQRILGKTIDLYDIFSNRYFYHPAFGSHISLGELPDILGLESAPRPSTIGSDSRAATAFEYQYHEADETRMEEVLQWIEEYMKWNITTMEQIYLPLREL